MDGRVYTRGGDDGTTSLAGGARVRKDDARVEAYGTVDEAASVLGFARAAGLPPRLDAILAFVHHRMYACAACLASPGGGRPVLTAEDTAALERAVDELSAELPPLRDFVLPGGPEPAARLHVARAVVRRAERRVVALEGADPEVRRFLNRASDLLFVAARSVSIGAEEPWDPTIEPPA